MTTLSKMHKLKKNNNKNTDTYRANPDQILKISTVYVAVDIRMKSQCDVKLIFPKYPM